MADWGMSEHAIRNGAKPYDPDSEWQRVILKHPSLWCKQQADICGLMEDAVAATGKVAYAKPAGCIDERCGCPGHYIETDGSKYRSDGYVGVTKLALCQFYTD